MSNDNTGPEWITDDSGTRFPPEPWRLGGSLLVSFFGVPPRELPASLDEHLPTGTRPVVLLGKALVGAAFVTYSPGSVLHYDELLSAVVVRSGRRIMATIPQIWVDSPASVAGGRHLWGIPKELADFTRSADGPMVRMQARDGGEQIASLTAKLGGRVRPGWQTLAGTIAQRLAGQTTISRELFVFRPRRVRTAWKFRDDGPLHYLAGRKPLASLALTDMSISFGIASTRS